MKSIRILNFPIFTNNINPKWDNWYSKIITKFKIDKDYYFTNFSRIVYIVLRLLNKIANYIINRKIKGYFNLYIKIDEVFNQLIDIYKNSNRK